MLRKTYHPLSEPRRRESTLRSNRTSKSLCCLSERQCRTAPLTSRCVTDSELHRVREAPPLSPNKGTRKCRLAAFATDRTSANNKRRHSSFNSEAAIRAYAIGQIPSVKNLLRPYAIKNWTRSRNWSNTFAGYRGGKGTVLFPTII